MYAFFFRISLLLKICLIFENVTKEIKTRSYIKIYNYVKILYKSIIWLYHRILYNYRFLSNITCRFCFFALTRLARILIVILILIKYYFFYLIRNSVYFNYSALKYSLKLQYCFIIDIEKIHRKIAGIGINNKQ